MLTALLQILVIFVRWWSDPNRLAAEAEKALEAAYERSLNEFRKRVAERDGDAVSVAIADRLRELRKKQNRSHTPQ